MENNDNNNADEKELLELCQLIQKQEDLDQEQKDFLCFIYKIKNVENLQRLWDISLRNLNHENEHFSKIKDHALHVLSMWLALLSLTCGAIGYFYKFIMHIVNPYDWRAGILIFIIIVSIISLYYLYKTARNAFFVFSPKTKMMWCESDLIDEDNADNQISCYQTTTAAAWRLYWENSKLNSHSVKHLSESIKCLQLTSGVIFLECIVLFILKIWGDC